MTKSDRIGIIFMALSVLIMIVEAGELSNPTITAGAFIFALGILALLFQKTGE